MYMEYIQPSPRVENGISKKTEGAVRREIEHGKNQIPKVRVTN